MEIRNDTADVLAQLIADQSDRNSDDRVQLTGEVLGIDSDGTVWVHIFGGEERTPVTSTNVVVRKGDVVYVMIGDGRADILGNVSRPSTDDTTAIMVDRRVDVVSERVHTIETDYIVAEDIEATTAYIEHLTANDVTAEEIVADHAEVGSLDANYAQIDFANVANGAIGTALIADAAISDAKILGVSANKLTAGTIDASNINVSNLRADTLIVNKLNGQPVFGGYVAVDSNGSGYHEKNPAQQGWYEISNGQMVLSQDTEVDDSKAYYSTSQSVALYDQSYIDGVESALNSRIDGAIETFSGSVVPTKQNYPYTEWYDTTTVPVTDNRAEHVGDLYYVVDGSYYAVSTSISGYSSKNPLEEGWYELSSNEYVPTQDTSVVSGKTYYEPNRADGYCYRFYYDSTSSQYMWVLIKDSDVTAALGRIDDLETFETSTSSWITDTDNGLETIRTNHTALSGTVDKTVKESVQLWYTKANATAPSKPSSQVTNNSQTGSNSYNKWNLAVPVYNASYPYYFFCWQFKLVDGTYAWSDVVYDQATSEAEEQGRTGVTLANANIKSSVQLWFSKANTTKPNKPTSQITSDSTSGNAWRIVVPTYSSSYPYYYYCYQQQKGDGTYQWTDVVYDEATSTAMKKAQAALPTSTFETFETTTFKNVKDTVDEHSITFTTYSEMTATDTSGATVTGLTNIVNSVNSSTNSNSSKISSLESTTSSQGQRLTSAETAIQQNANDIALRATKTEAYQLSQPNLTPYFLMPMTQTTDTYWDNISYTRFTQLEDGWAHFSYANSGSSTVNNYICPKNIDTLTPGGVYTLLIEFRNVSISVDGGSFYSQQQTYGQVWGTGSTGGFSISNTDIRALSGGAGALYKKLTLLDANSKDLNGTVRGSLPKTQFMSINQQVQAGQSVSYDLRLSLYEGEYTGPYKPYSGVQLYASQAELKVANDAIDARVEKNGVIAAINVSPETGVTIDASRVNINGAAIFTSGRLSESSLNNAYDAKGAASAVQTNLNNLQVGGRNLLRKTGSLTTSDLNLARATVTDGLIALTPTTSAAYASFRVHYLDFAEYGSGIYAVSFDAKLSGATSDYTTSNVLAYLGFQDPTKVDSAVLNSTYDRYTPARTLSSALTSDWKRYQTVVNVPDDLTTGTAAALSNGYMMVVEVGASAKKMPILIRRVKLERGNRATDWSPAPEDMASATQRVYYRTSTAASVAAPTTWVTANGNVWSQWTTKVPRLTQNADGSGTKYSYLYTCEQHRMGDGSIVCTAVLLDENTTVIDGGNIITNSITANKLQANSLTLGYINQNDAATAAALLNSNVVVGGKNLLPDSKPSAENLPKVSTANATNTFVTEDGFACYKGTGAGTSIAFYASNGKFTVALEANTQYTYSAWIKVTTTTSTTSLPFSFLSLGHFTVRNDNSTASDKTHEDVATERIYSPSTVTVGQWTKIVLTFTTNALSGSYFGVYSKYNYGTDYTLFIRDMKLEKGNKATDWTPSPEDQTTYVDTSLAESVESITATIDTEVDTLTGSITGVSNSLATLGTKVDNLLTKATELEKKTQWVKWDDTEGMIFGENGTAFNTRLKAENMTFNYGNQTMMTLSTTNGVDAPKVHTQRLELGSDWAITISGDMFAIDYIGS